MRKRKKEQKAEEAARKLAIKAAKAEAERLALEEEAALTEGMDDLEKVLMRSKIRAKVRARKTRGGRGSDGKRETEADTETEKEVGQAILSCLSWLVGQRNGACRPETLEIYTCTPSSRFRAVFGEGEEVKGSATAPML